MRTLLKNKQKLKYSLYLGNQPEFVYDEQGKPIVEYVDADGKEYYRETGNKIPMYSEPVEFLGNISLSGGESREVEFGVDLSAYDAILVMNKGELPISETSLIWHESEIAYKDIAKTQIEPKSADYGVARVSPSLNQTKYLLEKVVK